jgi:hypothetical protein
MLTDLVNSDLLFKGILLALIGFLFIGNRNLKEQNERLGNDISGLSVALQSSVDTTRNKFGQMQARTQAIVLSQEQAEDLLKKETEAIKERFDVRIKGIKTFSQAGVQYTIPVAAPGKDTVIYNNTERVYYTPYGTLYTNGDSLEGVLAINDTIRIVVSKGKRKTWWKLWEKRPLETNAFMSSPNGTIRQLKSVLVQ